LSPVRRPRGVDVLLVSAGGTAGWRSALRELQGSLARAGASVALAEADPAPEVRTFMLTDLVQARAARHAAERGLAAHHPGAVIYCAITAALLWPRPGAIWLDSLAARNRPGRHGLWQRRVERRRLRQAPLVLRSSSRALEGAPEPPPASVLIAPPVEPSGPSGPRDIAAITYGADPHKRRLPLVLRAWSQARLPGEQLYVAGSDRLPPGSPSDGVRLAGRLSPGDYRALLRRSRVFVTAPVREEFGLAALEALADGCRLVTTPAAGAYPALDLARRLDPRLVTDELAPAIRLALEHPAADYGERALELLQPFRRRSLDAAVAGELLPRLLKTWR
jgi:hypothetical protein